MKSRGHTHVRAIKPGCIGGGSRHEPPCSDTSMTVGAGAARAVHDRGETDRALHMERLRKRAHRSLPLQPIGRLFVTELVAVQPPEPLATFLADGRYLPRGMPMLKRVLALPGQTVCRDQSHHHRRQDRDGRGARTRWPRPTAARLAGLSRRRRGRSLPHELAVGGLPRWPIFRCAAARLRLSDGRSLFGRLRGTDHVVRSQTFGNSFVRSEHGPFLRPGQGSHCRRAQRRSRAAVRPARQRFTLDGREHDGSLAISRDDGVHRGDVSIINAVERCGACRASVVGHTSSERSNYRSLRGLCHRGVQALRRSGTLDTVGDARRERWRGAGAIAKRRNGADADHAAGHGPICALDMVSAPIPTIRATTYWLAPHTSANSTNDLACRVSSPPTMLGQDAMKIIWRQADRCRTRPKRMSRNSHRRSRANRLAERSSPSRSHLLWLAHRCSSCALRATQPSIARRPVCGQTVHQAVVPLSIYRLSCRSRATCSCTVPARLDRNDSDRASSQSVVGYRVF